MTINDLKYELDEICKNYGSADVKMLLIKFVSMVMFFTKERNSTESLFGRGDEFYNYYDGQVTAYWTVIKELVSNEDFKALGELVRENSG